MARKLRNRLLSIRRQTRKSQVVQHRWHHRNLVRFFRQNDEQNNSTVA